MVDRSALINRIYEASLDPSLWQSLLQEIARLIDANECVIVFHDRLNRTRNAAFSASSSLGITQLFLEEFIDIEMACLRPLFGQKADGVPISSAEIVDDDDLLFEDVLGEAREFHTAQGIEVKYGVRLLHTRYLTATLLIHRVAGAAPLSSSAMALIGELGPHLARAIRIHDRLSAIRNQNSTMIEALKHFDSAVILLDRNFRVIFSNAEAARVLEEHPAIGTGRSGRLRASRPDEQRKLDALLQRMSEQSGSEINASPSMALRHEGSTHPLKVTVMPLAGTRQIPPPAEPRIRLAVFFSDPERIWTMPNDYLASTYRLTPAEIIVAQQLLNGYSIADICEQRATSENTTRWQVKQIMGKTSTSSQAELVRLLAALSMGLSILAV